MLKTLSIIITFAVILSSCNEDKSLPKGGNRAVSNILYAGIGMERDLLEHSFSQNIDGKFSTKPGDEIMYIASDHPEILSYELTFKDGSLLSYIATCKPTIIEKLEKRAKEDGALVSVDGKTTLITYHDTIVTIVNKDTFVSVLVHSNYEQDIIDQLNQK